MKEFIRILISKKDLLDNLYKRKKEAFELIQEGKSNKQNEKDLDAVIENIFNLEFEIDNMLIESYLKEIEYLEDEKNQLIYKIDILKNTYNKLEKNNFITIDNILELRFEEIKNKYIS